MAVITGIAFPVWRKSLAAPASLAILGALLVTVVVLLRRSPRWLRLLALAGVSLRLVFVVGVGVWFVVASLPSGAALGAELSARMSKHGESVIYAFPVEFFQSVAETAVETTMLAVFVAAVLKMLRRGVAVEQDLGRS